VNLAATAEALAARIVAGGCEATADPRRCGSRPVVLVAPPTRDYRERYDTFNLVCLSATTHNDLTTLTALAVLVDDLRDALPGLVEEARPATYQLGGPESKPYPAYICRVVTTSPQE
jgi:hypothetical protein